MNKLSVFLKEFQNPVDEIGTKERASFLASRSIKNQTKIDFIKLAVSMIDLTTLEGKDSSGKVYSICQKAKFPLAGDESIGPVAAVCVYPNMISDAAKFLDGTGIHLASVATGFPSGQYPLKLKIEDTINAIESGADEIDMVISRGKFLEGDYEYVFNEIKLIKETCIQTSQKLSAKKKTEINVHLKVILETGELETYDNVRIASFIAMFAGADFIKTSTGKIQPAATLPVTLVMLEAIRDFYNETGILIGMKPAGGIRTTKEAISYLVLLNETLGYKWMNNDMFRIGASSLLNDLLMQYKKQVTGYYQSSDYYTID
ncbi:MAG TPA: deoxyribose-phosphate aldolase [Ignavibacteria bacterium]|nr:deoxyribose-phosphate aldolase [Ignavibacteria bacterium]